jgi:hypothetical protein
MNYSMLNQVIPKRCLPDDASAPRAKLFELWRTLDELREARGSAAADVDDPRAGGAEDASAKADLAALDKQIKFYERILEET